MSSEEHLIRLTGQVVHTESLTHIVISLVLLVLCRICLHVNVCQNKTREEKFGCDTTLGFLEATERTPTCSCLWVNAAERGEGLWMDSADWFGQRTDVAPVGVNRRRSCSWHICERGSKEMLKSDILPVRKKLNVLVCSWMWCSGHQPKLYANRHVGNNLKSFLLT